MSASFFLSSVVIFLEENILQDTNGLFRSPRDFSLSPYIFPECSLMVVQSVPFSNFSKGVSKDQPAGL